jgi:hypothetical protein
MQEVIPDVSRIDSEAFDKDSIPPQGSAEARLELTGISIEKYSILKAGAKVPLR